MVLAIASKFKFMIQLPWQRVEKQLSRFGQQSPNTANQETHAWKALLLLFHLVMSNLGALSWRTKSHNSAPWTADYMERKYSCILLFMDSPESSCSKTLIFEQDNHISFHRGVAGVMVSIVAFQAVDPGSIPGRRTSFFC